MKDIQKIRDLLTEQLDSENGNRCREQMAECEAWLATISQHYREAKFELAQLRLAAWPEYGTVDERKLKMESETAALQQVTDELKDLMAFIGQRITMGQTFLRSLQTEQERL